MKIAHLILCHSNPDQLRRLVNRLTDPEAHFYIHLDKKTNADPFLQLSDLPNVYFVNNRAKVSWGGYSIVQATLNGFEEILASGQEYDYINLLSGQDYPLKSNKDIHSFLAASPGKAFMHFLSVENEWQEAQTRISKYHLTNTTLPGKHRIERIMNYILPKRTLPGKLIAVGRSQWFTIHPAFAIYIIDFLKENASIERFFKYTWAPDEFIFQTILYNSDFRKDMINDNLRYIDWSAGAANPKVLGMADAQTMISSGKFYARKFNPAVDEKILDYLDSVISPNK